MSNLHSEASYMENLFNEISTFLSLKGVASRQTEVSPVASEESSDNTLNSVPAAIHNYGKEPLQGDSQLEVDNVCDSTYNSNNVPVDISSFNIAKKTENIDESQCKNTSLEDFKCHANQNSEEISLPNENQSSSDMTEQTNSEPIETIKCTDVNCETHIQGLCLLRNSSILKGNERSSPKNIYSEGVYETENYKRKQLVQKTPQDEERHCSYKSWDGKTGIERKNFGEKIINAAQQIEQQVETKERIICCTTDIDTKMPDEVQLCQIVEENALTDQQHFTASLSSSEIHDNIQYPLDIKNTHTHPDITLSESKVKNKETASKSHLCQSTESLQTLSSPDEKSDSDETFCSENISISSSSDDGKFKRAVIVPVKSACANDNTVVNLTNKPMVYSGEIAKVPCVAINKTLSNFRLKLSNQPKKVYIPSRFFYQYDNILKSDSVRNIPSESNVPILTPISPVMQIYPNIVSLNTTSTSSSPQKQTINHIPTSLGVKKEKRSGIKKVVLKSILPSTVKIVAKYVSRSGFSPVASSGIYSTAEICDKKTQLLDSSLPKNIPLILPSTTDAAGNTEVTHSVTATQSLSLELTPAEIPATESSVASLSILPSVPKEFSDTLNISITSQSTGVNTVKISSQESENKGSMHDPANQNVFIEDLSCHLPYTNTTATSSSTEMLSSVCKSITSEISSAENNKLNPLPDSDAVWTEDAIVCSKGKEVFKAHSSSGTNIGNVQIISKFKLSSRTTRRKKNKCEGAIGMTKTIELVHSTRRNRKILPKCGSEIKFKEKPNDDNVNSSIAEIEQKNKKTAKVSWNNRKSFQQNNRITKSNDSVFPESSTNKSNILNKTVIPSSGNEHKIIDNLKPKHVYTECKSKPSKFIENNILQQDLSGKAQYSESTSQEYMCSPSWISVGSDKRLQETTFMPHEVNNVDNDSHPSVFKFPSIVNNHYQTKDTQRCSPHSDTTSSSEPGCFSAEHDHSRKHCYSAAYGINADKGFNDFAVNQTSPLHGTFSTSIKGEKYKTQDLFSSAVHQTVPTSQIANPCLSNGDVNMFLKDNRYGNYSTKLNNDNCKYSQKTYSNVSENENNWCNRSKEWEYAHQQLGKLSQNNGDKVNISPGKNKYNAYCQSSNEIGPNIQNSNHVTNAEEDNFFFCGRNFNDTITGLHNSTEQVELISFLNYKKHLMAYLHGKTSAKGDGDVQQLQNEAMQNHSQNNENKIIPPICEQEKGNTQHFGKCCKRRRKTKGPSKSTLKLQRDKPYICCYCGKSEQYKAILQRHITLEHAYMLSVSTNI